MCLTSESPLNYRFGPKIDVWKKMSSSTDHRGDKLHDLIFQRMMYTV